MAHKEKVTKKGKGTGIEEYQGHLYFTEGPYQGYRVLPPRREVHVPRPAPLQVFSSSAVQK